MAITKEKGVEFAELFAPFLLAVVLIFCAAGYARTAENAKMGGTIEAKEATMKSLPGDLRARGGLAVLIGGADNPAPARELIDSGPWTIHWLDPDAEAVREARLTLQESGLYGRISVEHRQQSRLPYADNLVNLIIADASAIPVEEDELLRVLAPEGSAFIYDGDNAVSLKKPRPGEMGEWTHPWHDADGSLASSDRAVEPPNAFQWITGPPFPVGPRKDSGGVILSAGGRVFQITQNVVENLGRSGPNHLVARDAFNGSLLWSRRWRGPTSRGHAHAVHEAIVATADRIFASQNGEIVVLDAATGEAMTSYPTAAAADKLIISEGILIAQISGGLAAFDIDQDRKVWRREADDPWGTLARDGRVFCLNSTREKDGRWRHELLAVDLRNGEKLWTQPVESRYRARDTAVLRLHFAGDGIVCLIERRKLRVLSAEDGSELWSRRSGTEARGSGSMDSRQVGHFFIRGKVWMRMDRGQGREGPEPWLALDPMTGEVLREVEAVGPKGVLMAVNKVSCQPLTATERFVFDSRLATVWDFETGERSGWKFARGGCMVGIVPANGMAYAPPNACGCLGEQLRSNYAAVRTDDEGLRSNEPGPLERGPAYDERKPAADSGDSASWPMYRGGGQRGAYLPVNLPTDLKTQWQRSVALERLDGDKEWRLQIGRPLTPPVAGNGMVMLAEPQSHRLIALDTDTGDLRWHFTAGGRITTPPALYRGLALFGAHDGYVYALRADDGKLVWRRRAAPSDRRIMAYGQLESAWPVSGGVLVHNGMALVAAGRTADGDGGAVVHALKPATGEHVWSTRVNNARHGKPELLVTNGEHVFLMDRLIDTETGRVLEVEGFRYSDRRAPRYPGELRYLRSGAAGFLDGAWTQLGLARERKPAAQTKWTWGNGIMGFMLAFDQKTAFASRRQGREIEAYSVENGQVETTWSVGTNGQVETMALTDNMLLAAGPKEREEPEGPGFLLALDRQSGDQLKEFSLPAAPVRDGIAVAGNDIFLVLNDGSVICFRR